MSLNSQRKILPDRSTRNKPNSWKSKDVNNEEIQSQQKKQQKNQKRVEKPSPLRSDDDSFPHPLCSSTQYCNEENASDDCENQLGASEFGYSLDVETLTKTVPARQQNAGNKYRKISVSSKDSSGQDSEKNSSTAELPNEAYTKGSLSKTSTKSVSQQQRASTSIMQCSEPHKSLESLEPLPKKSKLVSQQQRATDSIMKYSESSRSRELSEKLPKKSNSFCQHPRASTSIVQPNNDFSGSNQKIKDQPVRTDKYFGNSDGQVIPYFGGNRSMLSMNPVGQQMSQEVRDRKLIELITKMDFVINKVTNIERLLNKRGQSPECKKTSKHITFDFPIRDLPHLETLEKMLEKKNAQLTLVSQLESMGDSTIYKSVSRILRHVFSNNMFLTFTWKGNSRGEDKSKDLNKLQLYHSVVDAVKKRFDTAEKKIDILEIDNAGILIFGRDRNTIKSKMKKSRDDRNKRIANIATIRMLQAKGRSHDDDDSSEVGHDGDEGVHHGSDDDNESIKEDEEVFENEENSKSEED